MKKRLGTMAGVLLLVLVMGMTVWAADAGVIDVDIKKNQVFQVNSDVELHEQPDAASAVTATLPGGTPVIAKEDAKDGWCLVAYQTQTGYVQTSILGLLGSPVIPVSVEDQPETAADEAASNETASVEDQPGEAASGSSVKETDTDEAASSQNGAGADETAVADGETEVDDGTKSDPKPDEENTPVQNAGALDEEFRSVQEANRMAYQEAENVKKQASSEKMWGIVIAVLVVAIFAVGIITALAGNKGKKK